MKRLLFPSTARAALAFPALADDAAVKVIRGCEVKEAANSGGKNFNKVDPTCVFRGDKVTTGSGSAMVDTDGDGIGDTYSADARG